MSSVSTAFKVHYNQKLGGAFGHLGLNAPWLLGGIDAPAISVAVLSASATEE